MQEILEGQFIHIIFRNEENGYTIGRVLTTKKEEVTITGLLMGVQIGEYLKCSGNWKKTERYGDQFQVQQVEVQMPGSKLGIEKYLSAGQIAGIGPVYAKRIVEKFGTATFEILDHTPYKLLEVEGIGQKTLERVTKSWQNQQNARSIVLFLQQYQISARYALRIYTQYAEHSLKCIQENPYRLATALIGIGFKKADEIARQMDIKMDSPLRIDAGISHVLDLQNRQGHSCYPLELFCEETAQLLSVDQALVENRLGDLVEQKVIVIESFHKENKGTQSIIWSYCLFMQEQQIVQESLRLLAHSTKSNQPIDIIQAIDEVTAKMRITLAIQQKKAVIRSLKEKFHIITGGPGTGKSTITKVILKILTLYYSKILLAAPTGRAAKRLSEITGRTASTIHAMLALRFGQNKGTVLKAQPLDCEVLIIDEASMIDNSLMAVLLAALPNHCRLILIGDIDQLPSVGPGNVLADLIGAGQIPVTCLTQIFRQAANSKIIVNAHKINNGLFPDIQIDKSADFFFIQETEAEKIGHLIVDLVQKRLTKTYGLHPMRDIQVLCPMHKTAVGTITLNKQLQEALNNSSNKKEQMKRGHTCFSVGDKVMQTKNNYEKAVFNGDIGYISKIKTVDKTLFVAMDDGREVEYEFSELIELELAYAVTVHKYQGSEAPCIVVPLHLSQYNLLFRNLLYTAVTRGKKLVVLVGDKKALSVAIQNDRAGKRYSAVQMIFNYEKERAFPTIKIAPTLGSPLYEAWLNTEFPHEIRH